MQQYIIRPYYIKKIRPFIQKDIIKVITGQRRVGKSYLLYQIIDEIKEYDPHATIIYINKELHDFATIQTSEQLYDYIKVQTNKKGWNYVFIDEIQDIVNFEKTLRSLQAEKNYDIYITGSNAKMLSSELATNLSGRYFEIKLFSLSYEEFLTFHDLQNNNESLLIYIKYGGLPFLVNLTLEDHIVYDYLKNIYSTILFKDVVARYSIRNVAFLERLVEYLADNTGSIVSAKKISDFLKSQKIQISPNIILNYLSYLTSTFFIFKVKRKEISGKKIFEIGEKYYFEDLGLRHTISGYNQQHINKVLENIIYLHLCIAGYTVYIGESSSGEIDFIGEKGDQTIYIQVAYLIADEHVHDREFGNLLSIKDNYQKFVVTMDEIIGSNYKGIRHMHVREFLHLLLSDNL